MKKILLAALLGTAAFSASAADIGLGVSINIGDPNYYGSIDVGNYPPPQVINPNPVIIQPSYGVAVAPIYLHVPPEHSRHWRRYCGMYNACGRPVYFVHEDWYRNVYGPRYRNDHQFRHDDRHDERHDDRRDDRHDDHHDHEHDHDH